MEARTVLIGLFLMVATSFNAIGQMEIVQDYNIYMQQSDGSRFKLNVSKSIDHESGDSHIFYYLLDPVDDYVYSHTAEFNYTPNNAQLELLGDSGMGQYYHLGEGDDARLIFYNNNASFACVSFEIKNESGVDYIRIFAVNLVAGTSHEFIYKVTGFEDKIEPNQKLKGGAKI